MPKQEQSKPEIMENSRCESLKFCRSLKSMSPWISGMRVAMHAASQLPGRGPTNVDDASSPAC